MRTMEKKRPYGLSLLLSILVLHLEAAIALVVSIVYGVTQESPNTGVGGSAMLVLLLPVIAVFTTVAAAALSVALVLPTAWLSDVLGRRFTGREAWWWVPAVAAVVSLLVVGVVVVLSGGGAGPLAVTTGWFLTTAALTVPALLCRSRRKRVFGPVLLWGVVAVVLTGVLGGVGLSTGLLREYRPPHGHLGGHRRHLVRREGRNTHLHGGRPGHRRRRRRRRARRLGHARRRRRRGSGGRPQQLYGAGHLGFRARREPLVAGGRRELRRMLVRHMEHRRHGGRPTLYQYIGDPDSWDLYKLTRSTGSSGGGPSA